MQQPAAAVEARRRVARVPAGAAGLVLHRSRGGVLDVPAPPPDLPDALPVTGTEHWREPPALGAGQLDLLGLFLSRWTFLVRLELLMLLEPQGVLRGPRRHWWNPPACPSGRPS